VNAAPPFRHRSSTTPLPTGDHSPSIVGAGGPTGREGRERATDADAAAFFGVPAGDARVPDVLGISQVGVVYTGKKKKIAEHGGDNPADRSVPLLVTGARIKHGGDTDDAPVETTQIAPTILQLLGLDPDQLESVQIEGTAPLPLETDNGG
jgi:hypothetical protein